MDQVDTDKSKEVLFKERQTFQQGWLRITVIVLSAFLIALSLYIIYEQLFLNIPVGDRPLSDGGVIALVIFMLALGIGLPIFMFRAALLVTVEREALRISFDPFTHRTIPIKSIIYCEPRTVALFREYWGYGVRLSFRGDGVAYIMNGSEGVQIELDNGKRLFVGSEYPEELARAVAVARSL